MSVLNKGNKHKTIKTSKKKENLKSCQHWYGLHLQSKYKKLIINVLFCFPFLSRSYPVVSSDRCMLLRGMFSFDSEGPEGGVWWGHHCNLDSQEEEEANSEERTGTTLHQLLPDHVIQGPAGCPAVHQSNLVYANGRNGMKCKTRGAFFAAELLKG